MTITEEELKQIARTTLFPETARVVAELLDLKTKLGEIEWCGCDPQANNYPGFCPRCVGRKDLGHMSGCALAEAIR